MLNIKPLFLNSCKRCISLQHNLAPSGACGGARSMTAAHCARTTRSVTSCLYSQTRCHSVKHAPNAGYDTVTPSENVIPTPNSLDSTETATQLVSKHEGDKPKRTRRGGRKKNKDHEHDWIKPEGEATGIVIYNSLTRSKEPLILTNGRMLSWYQCGPTVYDHAHIGHASSYMRTDMIRRVLTRLFNIDVVQVMGVTDIDDKIIKRSKELRYPNFQQLAQEYEASFFRDLDSLHVQRPTVKTRVTEHIPHIIRFVQQIIANGYAYTTPSGSVYFDVGAYPRYGKLQKMSDADISQRAEKEKKNVHDFALWKAAKPDEPFWESPFGRGRPGWHIECSTMASAVFGPTLDIHSGGDDLRFPHHENELAQSEACFCNKQWTNYWIHTGSLHLKNNEDKMSKSLKNTVSVHELLSKYTANQFRLFCMVRPYQQGLEYSKETMSKAAAIYSSWSSFLTKAESYIQGQLQTKPMDEQLVWDKLQSVTLNVEKALADDFDFSEVVHQLTELVDITNVELNRRPNAPQVLAPRSTGTIASVLTYMERTLAMLGMDITRRKAVSTADRQQFSSAVDSVVKFRSQVRKFALVPPDTQPQTAELSSTDSRDGRRQEMQPLLQACDEIRDDLTRSGIKINDHDKGASWNVIESPVRPPPSQRKT